MSDILKINTDRVSDPDVRAVYIADLDKPVFFPLDCIAVSCPGTGTEKAVADAIEILDRREPLVLDVNQLPHHDREVRETAYNLTQRLARGATLGNCELCLSFEGCWRRESKLPDTEV